MATTLVAQSFALPTTASPPHPKVMLEAVGVDREMFTYASTSRLPRRQSLVTRYRGANHPLRLTQRVRQQIKKLTLCRSTFYVQDFPAQPAMSSVKELDKVYLVICNPCYRDVPLAHRELALRANRLSFPMSKARGLPPVSLTLVSEEVMLAALDELSPRPVTVYMPRLLPPGQDQVYRSEAYRYRGDDEDDEHD